MPKNYAFELWCWRRLLRVPWTARRSNKSILREVNPEYSLEGLMLKLQYFGHIIRTNNLLEKCPMLGKIEGRRRRGYQRMRWLPGITGVMDMNLVKLTEMVRDSPCFVWKGFPTFRSHLRMRPVSRRHSRRGLVCASTLRSTPISRSPLEKNPMPGHLSEVHPVNEVNTKGQ